MPFVTNVLRQLLQEHKAGMNTTVFKYSKYHLPVSNFLTCFFPYSFLPPLPRLLSPCGSQAMISSISLCYSCIVSPAYFHNLPEKFITQQPAVWHSHTRSPIHTLLPPSQHRDDQRKFLPLYTSHTVQAEINCIEGRKKRFYCPFNAVLEFQHN